MAVCGPKTTIFTLPGRNIKKIMLLLRPLKRRAKFIDGVLVEFAAC